MPVKTKLRCAGESHMGMVRQNNEDRVHLDPDQQHVEDQALEAAHQDRAEGRSTLVIAQTSNEHLDELNARAQAIRRQHQELGKDGFPIPGRPYEAGRD